jgi:HAMP domain-containing protein
MKIRLKILSGFIILSLMLLIAGLISINEVTRIGKSVQKLVNENFSSIDAANKMTEALEATNSGIILQIIGQKQSNLVILHADSNFRSALSQAKNTAFYKDEKTYTDSVDIQYNRLYNKWINKPFNTKDIEVLITDLNRDLTLIKISIRHIQHINEQALVKTAATIEEKAHRAAMPGKVAIISAVLFTLIFNFFINFYFISPIIRITKGVENTLKYNTNFTVDVNTNDEIGELKNAIQKYIAQNQHPNKL